MTRSSGSSPIAPSPTSCRRGSASSRRPAIRTIDKDLKQRWHDFADDPEQCDVAGEMTFWEQEKLALRHMFVDGDILGSGTERGPLQLIEAHRIRTPASTKMNVVMGVLLDGYRRRLQYWFTKDEIDPLRRIETVSEMAKLDVRDEAGNRQVFICTTRSA
jgi:capsid protein